MLALFMYMEPKMYREKIVNLQTGEEIFRDYTNQEILQAEANALAAQAKAQAEAEAQAKRQALLDKLGITEEEARLLLGGTL